MVVRINRGLDSFLIVVGEAKTKANKLVLHSCAALATRRIS